jgi:hypothetical protein
MMAKCIFCAGDAGIGDICWEHAFMALKAQTEIDERDIQQVLRCFKYHYDEGAPSHQEAMHKAIKYLNERLGGAE